MPATRTDHWYANGLRFTCTQCGNCCTGPPGFVWFTDEEATAIADELGVSVAEFLERYTHRIGSRRSLSETPSEHGRDCVFLQRDGRGTALCSIYAVRPQQCRTWPFWPENLRSKRTYTAIANRCPGMKHGLEGRGAFYPIEQIRVIRDATPDM